MSKGRDRYGRFKPGYEGGPGGSAQAAKASAFRIALQESCTPDDLKKIVASMLDIAVNGAPTQRIQAGSILLDRFLGRPAPTDLAERLEHLETVANKFLKEREGHNV